MAGFAAVVSAEDGARILKRFQTWDLHRTNLACCQSSQIQSIVCGLISTKYAPHALGRALRSGLCMPRQFERFIDQLGNLDRSRLSGVACQTALSERAKWCRPTGVRHHYYADISMYDLAHIVAGSTTPNSMADLLTTQADIVQRTLVHLVQFANCATFCCVTSYDFAEFHVHLLCLV